MAIKILYRVINIGSYKMSVWSDNALKPFSDPDRFGITGSRF